MIDIVYVEKNAAGYPLTEKVIKRLPGAAVVPVGRWEDVFFRKKQNFALQKKRRKLIVGVNRTGFVMKGSDNCQSAGFDCFYYCSFAKNCIGACDYCYLQGMFRSGNLLVFANVSDCFKEVDGLLEKEGIGPGRKMLLAVSYDNDIYALEGLFGFVKLWTDYAARKNNPGLTVEIRTKCGTRSFLDGVDPSCGKSVVFTWSVSSEENIRRFEPLTSPLEARLECARYALEKGLRVRLALDPVLALDENSLGGYRNLCLKIAEKGINRAEAVMLGGFRIPADYLKIMRRNAPLSALSFDRYDVKNGTACYPAEKNSRLTGFVSNALENVAGFEKEKIIIYENG